MLEEIRDIFATFHDGSILEYEGDLNQLTLKVECEYLAKEFNTDFKNFYLIIYNIDFIEFQPWMNPFNLKKINTSDLIAIFKAKLEIGYAEIENNIINVSCSQHNLKFDYCGGNLLLKAQRIILKNHLKEIIKPTELYGNSEIYWSKINQR